MEPLWYVDADTLGLAHVLARARPDVTYPGDNGVRHKKSWQLRPCIIADPAMHDDQWIPTVARAGMAEGDAAVAIGFDGWAVVR